MDLDGKRVLEVGALGDPMFPEPAGFSVRYLDWFDRDELVASHLDKKGINVDAIVDVDYVVKSKRFADGIGERFDLIVANHVIEHIPDPINWVQQLSALVHPGAWLFLSVPDKRFTFDYLREPSTVVQLIRAHEEDLERADMWQVLDARFFHRPLRLGDFADGSPPPHKLAMRRFDLQKAIQHARKAATNLYTNVHCFTYTPSTFEDIIGSLREAHLISWTLVEISDTEPGMNEFHVLLRRD